MWGGQAPRGFCLLPEAAQASHISQKIFTDLSKRNCKSFPQVSEVITEALLPLLPGPSKSPLRTLATAGLRVCIPSFLILLGELLMTF